MVGEAWAALWNWARGQKKALELRAWAAEPAFPFWPLIWVCLQEFTPPLLPAAGHSPPPAASVFCVDWASLPGTVCVFCLVLGPCFWAVDSVDAVLSSMPTPGRALSSGGSARKPPGDPQGRREGPGSHKMCVCKSFRAAELRGLACNHSSHCTHIKDCFHNQS